MVKVETLKRAVSVPLKVLLQFADYVGLDRYSQQTMNRHFPSYVAEFERRYGHFRNRPELVFEPLGPFTGGEVKDYMVILNTTPQFISMIFMRRDTLRHELSHIVINEIVSEVNPDWLFLEDGNVMVQTGMALQGHVIMEGCADYLMNQNGGKSVSYPAEYFFVKPILDRRGMRDGIEKLLQQPPTNEELKKPENYYQRLGLK